MASVHEARVAPSYNETDGTNGLSVSARRLTRTFGAIQVLKQIDLDVQPGEFVAIVGRSGSGKSTLLRLFSGLDAPSSGEALLNGAPVRGLNPDVRVMFQEARLLPWKHVAENVALGLPPRERGERAATALAQVGLEKRAKDWPDILSGGQRQRVALARALAARPRLLFFDEPLGALDALTRREMQQLVEDVWQTHGFTAILVTHDVEEAVALADRIILLENGRITMDVPVRLPRPRHRDMGEFVALRESVLARLLNHASSPERPSTSISDIK